MYINDVLRSFRRDSLRRTSPIPLSSRTKFFVFLGLLGLLTLTSLPKLSGNDTGPCVSTSQALDPVHPLQGRVCPVLPRPPRSPVLPLAGTRDFVSFQWSTFSSPATPVPAAPGVSGGRTPLDSTGPRTPPVAPCPREPTSPGNPNTDPRPLFLPEHSTAREGRPLPHCPRDSSLRPRPPFVRYTGLYSVLSSVAKCVGDGLPSPFPATSVPSPPR